MAVALVAAASGGAAGRPDGRRTLVLGSDNNFAPAQFTQFLLFAFSEK